MSGSIGQRNSLGGSRNLTTYPNICEMYCTGFHSHSASHTGSRPWCDDACLAGRPPICASSAALALLVQVVVHCGPLLTVTWWSHSLALRQIKMQTRSFSVVGPTTWNGLPIYLRHLPNDVCSQLYHPSRLFLRTWPGSGAPLSKNLEGALCKFLLID